MQPRFFMFHLLLNYITQLCFPSNFISLSTIKMQVGSLSFIYLTIKMHIYLSELLNYNTIKIFRKRK